MLKMNKNGRKKSSPKKAPAKSSTGKQQKAPISNIGGYKIVRKPSKPDFSEEMIDKLVASSTL